MIQSVSISHFKSVVESKLVRLQDLSIFIGNNGTGKSSVLEALKTLQDVILSGLSEALTQWGGYEQVRNYHAVKKSTTGKILQDKPIKIVLVCLLDGKKYHYEVAFSTTPNGDYFYVAEERLRLEGQIVFETMQVFLDKFITAIVIPNPADPADPADGGGLHPKRIISAGSLYLRQPNLKTESPAADEFAQFIRSWQFLNLNAHLMGQPSVVDRANPRPRLLPDGSNVAIFLRRLADNPAELNTLVDKMRFVLPYMADIRPKFMDELERKVFVEMKESGSPASIPGWLLSTGTLRILTLLVAMSQKPGVLFIEEIENGLDPRTIGLLLSEIRTFAEGTGQQIVATSHSPYLLDLLDLKHLIVTEKNKDSATTFHRVDTDQKLQKWKEKFSPGQLYTMGKLHH